MSYIRVLPVLKSIKIWGHFRILSSGWKWCYNFSVWPNKHSCSEPLGPEV